MLKSIQKPTNLKNFKGKTLAVDAYGWLHRGTVSCAVEIATDKPTRKYVDFAVSRVRMLLHFGITPYIIFDGDYLPSKANTESSRALKRSDSRSHGLELLKAGRSSAAQQELQKCVDVTPEMARHFIDELKQLNVKYIVAPYEADPQMVYLERHGIVDGILSEDSDLLVFGAKCLLTKLDQYGDCTMVNKADFTACKDINLTGWTDREFRAMCILSGCDYLASVSGMGLKTSYRMVRKHKTIENVVRMLRFDGKYSIPKNYLDTFQQAELTFLHQRVYDPRTYLVVHHTKPMRELTEEENQFIGPPVDSEIATRVASGELNPMTKLPIHTERSVLPRGPFNRSEVRPILRSNSESARPGVTIGNYFKATRIHLQEQSANIITKSPPTSPVVPDESMMEAERILRRVSGGSVASRGTVSKLQRARTFLGAITHAENRPSKRLRLGDEEDDLAILEKNTSSHFGPSPFFGSAAVASGNNHKTDPQEELAILDETLHTAARVPLPIDKTEGLPFTPRPVDPIRFPNSIPKFDSAADVPQVVWDELDRISDEFTEIDEAEDDDDIQGKHGPESNEIETVRSNKKPSPHIAACLERFLAGAPPSSAEAPTASASRRESLPVAKTRSALGRTRSGLRSASSNFERAPSPLATPATQAASYFERFNLNTPPASQTSIITTTAESKAHVGKPLFGFGATSDTPPYTPASNAASRASRRSGSFQVYRGKEVTPDSTTPSLRRPAVERMKSVPFPTTVSRRTSGLRVSHVLDENHQAVGDENADPVIMRGSEDMLVPDSEDDVSDSSVRGTAPRLNLGRFTFNA